MTKENKILVKGDMSLVTLERLDMKGIIAIHPETEKGREKESERGRGFEVKGNERKIGKKKGKESVKEKGKGRE